MAVSPSRISTATQYQNLHRTGAASSQCVQLIDKILQDSDYYRADPDKVKLTYIVDTLTKIEILNSDYMKDLLAKQIKEAYVEAGWKDAYITIEYREDEYVNRRGEPQWISVHSLEVELYFFQDDDNRTEEAVPAETKQTVTMPDTVQLVGKDITISSGDTITITIDKPIVQETVQAVGFMPAGTPTGEYRIVSDNGGTIQKGTHNGSGGVFWQDMNHVQAQEFITHVTQLTVNAALRVFAPAGTPI